jgi:hypothetical protein
VEWLDKNETDLDRIAASGTTVKKFPSFSVHEDSAEGERGEEKRKRSK